MTVNNKLAKIGDIFGKIWKEIRDIGVIINISRKVTVTIISPPFINVTIIKKERRLQRFERKWRKSPMRRMHRRFSLLKYEKHL